MSPLINVLVGDVHMSREDYEYVCGAAVERGQSLEEFALEALIEHASR